MHEQHRTGSTTAYICECGKKWIFPKTVAAAPKVEQFECDCGKTLAVGGGLIYCSDDPKR